MKCNKCQNENICHDGNHELTRHGCAENGWCCFVPITNADRLRAMTDEELADFLWHRDIQIVESASKVAGFNYSYDEAQCIQNIKDWLKQEAER